MDWLTYADAERHISHRWRNDAFQVLSLYAETQSVKTDIPLEPTTIDPKDGPPTTVYQWFGKINDRLFAIELEATGFVHANTVTITTPFLQDQCYLGDWTVLQELQPLPASIHVGRPAFIGSRTSQPPAVVYRADPHGWNNTLYNAASLADAEQLLIFLHQDRWNDSCFIGKPEPPGKWAIFQGDEVILGTGSGLNWTLRSACELSSRNPSTILQVRDLTGYTPDVYSVSKGNVLPSSKNAGR